MADVQAGLAELWAEIEKDAAMIEGDIVGALTAAWDALRYNDVAAAMTAFAALVQDVKNDAAALEADAQALVPADVKAFLQNGQTLNLVVPAPLFGDTVVVLWRGASVQDLIAAIASGATQL